MSSLSKKKKIGLIIVATFLLLAIIAILVIFAINATYVYEPIHANLLLKEGETSTITINYNGAEGKPESEVITAEAFSYVDLPEVHKDGYVFLCWFCNFVIVWDSKLYVNSKSIKAYAQFEKDYSNINSEVAIFNENTKYTEYTVGDYPSLNIDAKDIYVEGGYEVEVYTKNNYKGDCTKVIYQGTYSGDVGSMKIRKIDTQKTEVQELTDDYKASLLKEYAPRLFWDENEKYFASTVEFAQEHLTRELSPDGYMLYLKELDKQNYTCDYFYGDKENMQGYGFAVEKEYTYLDLLYYFYFPYNKAKTILGINFGNHVGDWEHVMVRLKLSNDNGVISYEPVFVQYSIHSQRIYLAWDNAPKYENTHMIGYIANGSHGIWPNAGKNVYVNAVVVKLSDICSEGEAWNLWEGDNLATFKYDALNHCGDGIGNTQWKSWFDRDFYNPDSTCAIRWGNYGYNYPIQFYPQLQNGPECPIDKKGVCDYFSIDSKFKY